MNTKSLLTRIAVPVLSLGMLGGLGVTLAGAASASTGPGDSNGQVGQMTGNKATAYIDPVFGPVQCNETQHAGFDTVSCKAVPGINADGTAVKGTALLLRPASETSSVGWNSDFAGNARLGTGALAYTVNDTGTGYTGQATYPAS